MGTSDKVLKAKVDQVIAKLDLPIEVDCKAHGPLAEGVKVLLEIQRAILDGKASPANSIRVGNLTVTGGLAVTMFAVGYMILKYHEVI